MFQRSLNRVYELSIYSYSKSINPAGLVYTICQVRIKKLPIILSTLLAECLRAVHQISWALRRSIVKFQCISQRCPLDRAGRSYLLYTFNLTSMLYCSYIRWLDRDTREEQARTCPHRHTLAHETRQQNTVCEDSQGGVPKNDFDLMKIQIYELMEQNTSNASYSSRVVAPFAPWHSLPVYHHGIEYRIMYSTHHAPTCEQPGTDMTPCRE